MNDQEKKEFLESKRVISRPGSPLLVTTYTFPDSYKKKISDAIRQGRAMRRARQVQDAIEAGIAIAVVAVAAAVTVLACTCF